MRKRRAHKPVTVVRRRNVVLRYKYKYERRQTAYKLGQFLAVASLAVFGVFFGFRIAGNFLFCSDCFKIKKIEVRGAKNISAGEITALMPFREGDNIFKAPIAAAEKNLRQCKPELKKLSVSRAWQSVVIRFEERLPVAFVKAGGERQGLDWENKPFPLRGMYARKQLPEIIAGDEAGRKDVLDFIKVFEPRAKKLYPGIVRFYAGPANSVSFELNTGLKVIWGGAGAGDVTGKLAKLNQVLFDAEERFKAVEYVDLFNFESGRIIVKPRKAGAKNQISGAGRRSGPEFF